MRTVEEARASLATYFRSYNRERIHESLDYRTPYEIYFDKEAELPNLVKADRSTLYNQIYCPNIGDRHNLVETPNAILLTNVGSFLPGDIEIVIKQDAPHEIYRNPCLADAMVNLNMIDTQGGGIKKMFQTQKERFFPLPDFDLSNPNRVIVKIQGEILDERYTRLLMKRTDLDLHTVLLLDKVQKRSVISREDSRRLKAMKVIEGRYPNLYVSSWVADATGEKARHIRDGGLDNQYYKDLLVKLIAEHSPVNREEIDKLLWEKLPEVLSERQKKGKIHNLISSLAANEKIRNEGNNRSSKWVLGVTKEH